MDFWACSPVICVDDLRNTQNTIYCTMWVWVEIGADKLQNGNLMFTFLDFRLSPCTECSKPSLG